VNGLDVVFGVVVGLALLRGIWRGLIREVSSLLALGAGLFVVGRYGHEVALSLRQIVDNPQVAAGLSYVGVFLAAFVAVIILAGVVRKFMHAVLLGWLDRLGGGVLGTAKGLLISCLLLFVLTLVVPPRSAWIAESRLAPYLNLVTQKMVMFIPEGLKQSFADKSRTLHRLWDLEKAQGTEPDRMKESPHG
jgi:membrane protein required for colicin V production